MACGCIVSPTEDMQRANRLKICVGLLLILLQDDQPWKNLRKPSGFSRTPSLYHWTFVLSPLWWNRWSGNSKLFLRLFSSVLSGAVANDAQNAMFTLAVDSKEKTEKKRSVDHTLCSSKSVETQRLRPRSMLGRLRYHYCTNYHPCNHSLSVSSL